MDQQKVLEKAFETLADVSKNVKSRSAARLEAMGGALQSVPWEQVHTLDVDWKTMPDSDGALEFLPTLKVVMKGELP